MNKNIIKIKKTIDTLKLNILVLGKCISPFLIHKELDRSKLIQFYSENQSSYFMVLMMIDSISIDLKKSFTGPLDILLQIEKIQSLIWKLRMEFRNYMESSLSTGFSDAIYFQKMELIKLHGQLSTTSNELDLMTKRAEKQSLEINQLKNNQNEGLNSDD